MFDLLRDLTKSAEEKRQEQITAYVDGELSPRERQRFEQQLADDSDLQAEVAELQQFKQNLRQLPRRRVPRNFTLDPARYQAPQRQPLLQLYPAMRVATVLTAVFLIIAISADLLTFGAASEPASSAAPVAMQSAPAEEAAMDTAADAEMAEMAVEAEVIEEESLAYEAPESANVAEEAAPEPQVEMTAEVEIQAETAVMEAEEMAEAPPEEPMAAAPVQTTKETPAELEAESSLLTEESVPLDEGAADAAGADAPQVAVAATPSPVGTQMPDTPRIQPTPTLAERVVKTEPAATEIAIAPQEADQFEQGERVETAVSTPQPLPPSPISPLRVIQIVLAVLLIVLGTAVWVTRRQL